MIEFGADAYAHRKQVGVKQLYNQVLQTAWLVSLSQFEAEFELQLQLEFELQFSSNQFKLQLGTRCCSESQHQTEGLRPLGPTVEQPSRMRKKCCYGQRNLGSICGSLSPSPTHLSHITNINPFATLSRTKCERYIFIKKRVRSFIEVVMFLLTSACI